MECLHFGTPPSNFGCWESKTVYIHNFLDLPDTKGNDNVVTSPEFKCFGHTWQLAVYPGGDYTAKGGNVSVFIRNKSNVKVTLDFKIALLDADGKEYYHKFTKEKRAMDPNKGYGGNLVEKAFLIENQSKHFINGALKIKVQMRLSKGCYHNIISKHLPVDGNVDIFQDDETSDIAFDLEGGILLAHKCIIKSKAKDFYVMCEGYSVTSPMPITDVDNNFFKMMLRSLYGGDVLPGEWQEHSEAILKAAGKYGFDILKREAEVWYANSLKLTVENVIDEFMKADGNNHVGVKAAAKKFIIDHGEEVVASESFHSLYESTKLVTELAAHLSKELVLKIMAGALENSKKR